MSLLRDETSMEVLKITVVRQSAGVLGAVYSAQIEVDGSASDVAHGIEAACKLLEETLGAFREKLEGMEDEETPN